MFGMLLMMMAIKKVVPTWDSSEELPQDEVMLNKMKIFKKKTPCTFGAHFVLRKLPWEWRIGFCALCTKGTPLRVARRFPWRRNHFADPSCFVWSWACCRLTVIKCIYPDNQCIYPDNQTISWTHGHKHMGIYAGNLKCDKWSWFRQPNARGEKAWFCDRLEWWGEIEFVRRKSQSYLTSFIMGIILEGRKMSLDLSS